MCAKPKMPGMSIDNETTEHQKMMQSLARPLTSWLLPSLIIGADGFVSLRP